MTLNDTRLVGQIQIIQADAGLDELLTVCVQRTLRSRLFDRESEAYW